MPDRVLAALAVDARPGTDPVETAVRLDAFQRASVNLALERGNVVAGPIGDHGVMFLVAGAGSSARKRAHLVNLAEHARRFARQRFGLSLHFGFALGTVAQALGPVYQSALRAAQSSLTLGSRSVAEESAPSPHASSLAHLRDALASTTEERPDELPARFDRYVEVVSTYCAHRLEPAGLHFGFGFERMTEALVRSGALDAKSLSDLRAILDRNSGSARSVTDLASAYRAAVRDVVEAVRRPVDARRDRSLRRAAEYIEEHYAEDLSLERVARVAGFNPSYFSVLFHAREQVTFGDAVRRLRIARAEELLRTTDLPVARVAELSGYRSLTHFCRAYRRQKGITPTESRPRRGRSQPNVS